MISVIDLPFDYSIQVPALIQTLRGDTLLSEAQPEQMPKSSSAVRVSFLKNISRWSLGASEALRFDAPLVAIVELQNPRLSAEADSAADDKGANSIKGGTASVAPSSFLVSDCLSPMAMLPKAAISSVFQVQVKGQVVASLPTQAQAQNLVERLQPLLQDPRFDATTLKATTVEGRASGQAGETLLFQLDADLAKQFERNPDLIAIAWINSLRSALDVPSLALPDAQAQMYALTPTEQQIKGNVSWYDPAYTGTLTATGETFTPTSLTAAHPTLPFDTYLKVTNQQNQESVIVRVNDRGPFLEGRSLDVSGEAAHCLDSKDSGVVPFQAVVMTHPDQAAIEAVSQGVPEAISPSVP